MKGVICFFTRQIQIGSTSAPQYFFFFFTVLKVIKATTHVFTELSLEMSAYDNQGKCNIFIFVILFFLWFGEEEVSFQLFLFLYRRRVHCSCQSFISNNWSDGVDAKGFLLGCSDYGFYRAFTWVCITHCWYTFNLCDREKPFCLTEMQYDVVNTVYQIYECIKILRFFLCVCGVCVCL